MAEKVVKTKSASKVEKRGKKEKSSKKEKKIKEQNVAKVFSLLADEKTIDPALSSLFAVKVCYMDRNSSVQCKLIEH